MSAPLALFPSPCLYPVMGEALPTLLQKGPCNTDCCESKCTIQRVDRNWNGKYVCEKLTVQLPSLNHAFLIGHMFSVHKHMLHLVFIILLPNYCIMVNFSQNPYDQYLKHWNFSFSDHCRSYRTEYLLGQYGAERRQGSIVRTNTCTYRRKKLTFTRKMVSWWKGG